MFKIKEYLLNKGAVCLLTIAPFLLKSQNQYTVKGIVKDENSQELLVGATIILDGKPVASSQIDGSFTITANEGSHNITVKFIGYQDFVKTIKLPEDKDKIISISLKPAEVLLNTVIISASRYEQKIEEVPVSMEVIKPKFIENRNTYNLETAVKQIPGVDINDGQVSIRGGSGYSYGAGSRVTVLVDDLPLLSADAGDIKFNYLPTENIAQVEVIKGASSVLYGSSSLNGIINIITKDPTNEPETRISFFHGVYNDPVRPDSTGSRRDSTGQLRKPLKWWGERANPIFTGMNFSHGRLVNRFSYVVSGNAFADQGYREGATEQRARINTKTKYYFNENKKLYAGINASYMWVKASYFLLWQNADSGALRPRGGVDTPATTLNFFNGYRLNVDPYIVYRKSDKTTHSFKSRFYRTVNNSITKQGSDADLYYMEYRIVTKLPRGWNLSGGAMQIFNVVKSELYGDHNGMNSALYGQFEKKWERLSLTLGLRGEYFKVDSITSKADILFPKNIKFTSNTTEWKDTLILMKNAPIRPVFRIGANYRAHKATFIRASFGQGYRFPSIAEMFVNTNLSTLKIFPNPNLMPETGWSTEIGIKQGITLGKFMGYLDVAGFWMEYQNMIEFNFGQYYPDSITSPTLFDYFNYSGFRSTNVSRARISGYEVTLVGNFKWKDWNVDAMAGYTYMNPINLNYDSAYRATFSDTTTNMLKYRFKHMFRSDLQVDYKKWGFGFSTRYNSFMVNIDRMFEEPLFGTIEASKILPGLKEYRRRNNRGFWIFDARLIYRLNKNTAISLVSNNVFNVEYMGRPGDIQPPRTLMFRYDFKF
ncbi:MAG: hypothetical protein KatS3mg034_0676 [Vicingaceae bacterium]|nr:MAG: hypothetical protein KatS3mg034_0676 [Vicingaceae bacterium]